MITKSEAYRHRVVPRLERSIRAHCLQRIVKNDGVEITDLLKDVCSGKHVWHNANFMFEVEVALGGKIAIFAEPIDDNQEYIRIIGYHIGT